MKKTSLIRVLIALAIVIGAATWLYTCDARGLERYATEWFSARGVKPPEFDCSMEAANRSRSGRCYFQWPPAELGVIESGLKLIEAAESGKDLSGCSDFSAAPGVKRYSSAQPPGPMAGNSTSSFDALYLDRKTGRACIALFYPYG